MSRKARMGGADNDGHGGGSSVGGVSGKADGVAGGVCVSSGAGGEIGVVGGSSGRTGGIEPTVCGARGGGGAKMNVVQPYRDYGT